MKTTPTHRSGGNNRWISTGSTRGVEWRGRTDTDVHADPRGRWAPTRRACNTSRRTPTPIPNGTTNRPTAGTSRRSTASARRATRRTTAKCPCRRIPGNRRGCADDEQTVELGWNIPATESADSMTFLIRFTMHDVRSGDYLDLVAAYDVDKGRHIERTGSGDRLAALKRSESEQRRQWEENKRNAARACLIYWAVTLIAGVALCVLSILAVALSHLRSRYRGPIAYWRDKPSVIARVGRAPRRHRRPGPWRPPPTLPYGTGTWCTRPRSASPTRSNANSPRRTLRPPTPNGSIGTPPTPRSTGTTTPTGGATNGTAAPQTPSDPYVSVGSGAASAFGGGGGGGSSGGR